MAQVLYTEKPYDGAQTWFESLQRMVPEEAKMNDGHQRGLRTFGLAGWAEKVGLAPRDRYHKSGHPWGLTFLHATGAGDWEVEGASVWPQEGMRGLVKKVLTSPIGLDPQTTKGFEEHKMEYCFWVVFFTLLAIFSCSLVFLAICLVDRMYPLAM